MLVSCNRDRVNLTQPRFASIASMVSVGVDVFKNLSCGSRGQHRVRVLRLGRKQPSEEPKLLRFTGFTLLRDRRGGMQKFQQYSVLQNTTDLRQWWVLWIIWAVVANTAHSLEQCNYEFAYTSCWIVRWNTTWVMTYEVVLPGDNKWTCYLSNADIERFRTVHFNAELRENQICRTLESCEQFLLFLIWFDREANPSLSFK